LGLQKECIQNKSVAFSIGNYGAGWLLAAYKTQQVAEINKNIHLFVKHKIIKGRRLCVSSAS
jgi:hypothetical protein